MSFRKRIFTVFACVAIYTVLVSISQAEVIANTDPKTAVTMSNIDTVHTAKASNGQASDKELTPASCQPIKTEDKEDDKDNKQGHTKSVIILKAASNNVRVRAVPKIQGSIVTIMAQGDKAELIAGDKGNGYLKIKVGYDRHRSRVGFVETSAMQPVEAIVPSPDSLLKEKDTPSDVARNGESPDSTPADPAASITVLPSGDRLIQSKKTQVEGLLNKELKSCRGAFDEETTRLKTLLDEKQKELVLAQKASKIQMVQSDDLSDQVAALSHAVSMCSESTIMDLNAPFTSKDKLFLNGVGEMERGEVGTCSILRFDVSARPRVEKAIAKIAGKRMIIAGSNLYVIADKKLFKFTDGQSATNLSAAKVGLTRPTVKDDVSDEEDVLRGEVNEVKPSTSNSQQVLQTLSIPLPTLPPMATPSVPIIRRISQ